MRLKTTVIAALFISYSLHSFAQVQVPNANFEDRHDTTAEEFEHWIKEGTGTIAAEKKRAFSGSYSAKFSKTESTGRLYLAQEFPFQCTSLKKYKIRCAIKTKNLKTECGIGARVFDKDGNSITGYNAIVVTKNQNWKQMEGEFYADEKAVKVRIFLNITGSGNAWFDNIQIEEIPLSMEPCGISTLQYVAEYFDYVYAYSIVRDSAYLQHLKSNTFKLCAGNDALSYCQNILKRYTTLKLNDGHSFFWSSSDWNQYRKGSKNTIALNLVNFASGYMTEENIAYLNVPAFASLDPDIIDSYVDSLQGIIRRLDEQNPKGWIVDLSENSGGNSFAMLGGLGPILGNGICGYSQSADGSKRTRVYDKGYAGWFPDTTFLQKTPVYKLVHSALPIAVIYGKNTGSSGEVTAISFRGLEHSKSFGQKTYGATTRIDNLEMSDGATLNLACGWDVDRTGKVYTAGVEPDVPTDTHDQALAAAIRWILENR